MGESQYRFDFALSLLLAPLLCGCMHDLVDSSGSGGVDEAAVLAEAATYRDGATFDHISGSYYPSALATTSYIQLYANRTASSQYALIDPGATGSNAIIPVGGIIVREVLDKTGAPQRLTIMAKGPAGYNPAIGDWFWAVTDLDGTPIVEQDVPRVGRLTDCYGCHVPRANDDYLFGVPLADRGASGSGSGSGSGSSTPPPGGTHAVCGDFACEADETKDTCPQDCNHGHKK